MKVSRLALLFILGFMSTILLSQEQSGETKLGSESPTTDVYKVGGKVSAPRVIHAPDPHYTKEARQNKIEGKVVLWVVVGPDGRARDFKVLRSLGYGLDEEAVKAVEQWKFKPSKLKGQPVAVKVNIEVNFRLP